MALSSTQKLNATVDAAQANDEWIGLKLIKPITKENLKNGSGPIEFLPQNFVKNGCVEVKEIHTGEKVFTFGKHKGKSYDWVKANDSSYYYWAKDNLPKLKLP